MGENPANYVLEGNAATSAMLIAPRVARVAFGMTPLANPRR